MATAPTPPVRPMPPTAPAVAPVTMTTSSDSSASTTATQGKNVSPERTAVGKEIDSLSRAFQGTQSQVSPEDKSSASSKSENHTTETAPTIGSFNTQDETSTKTEVPAAHQLSGNKGPSSGYVWFVIAVLAAAAVLIGVRMYKNWNKQRRIHANSDRKHTLMDEGAAPVSKPRTAKKANSSFDFRV